MSRGIVKRIVAGALAGAIGGTLAAGTLMAQAPATPTPVTPTPVAPAAGVAAAGTQAPEWQRGRWFNRCGDVRFIELGSDFLTEYDSDGATSRRAEAAYVVAGDVVVVTIGRALTPDPEVPTGLVIVVRRAHDGLRLIGFDDPRQPDRSPPRDLLRRCP